MEPEIIPEVDEFADAFELLTASVPTEPGGKLPVAETPPAAPEVKAETPPAAPEVKAETPPAAPEVKAETPPETPPAAPDYAAEIAALKSQLEALKTAPQTPAPAAPAAAPAEPPPLYAKDEQDFLTKYHEDWPDIAKGEMLQRRAEYRDLVKYVFDQVAATYGPVAEYMQTRSGKEQYSDIKGLVPDYDQVRDATIAWAKSQPAYLASAYDKVISEGSAEDVADLITRFKKETNYTAPAASTPAATPAVPAKGAVPVQATLPEKARQAAAALRVVSSKRSESTSGGADPNDFEAAFAEFAKG
jgi:hypothetical protein